MENILEETRFIMKKYNIRANKNAIQSPPNSLQKPPQAKPAPTATR